MNKIMRFARNKRIKRYRSVLAFSFIQRLLMSISMNIIGPVIPLITGDLKIGLEYMGRIISLGTIALLIAAMGTGFLLEVFGFKRTIFTGALLILSGCLGLVFSSVSIIFIIAYTILQTGIGMIGVATLSLVGNNYYKNKSKSIITSNIGLTAGAVIAPLIVSLSVYINMGWQFLFLYLAVPQIILIIILIFIGMPAGSKDGSAKSLINLFHANRIIASHPYIILCCFITFLYVSVTQTFYTWFTSYFSALNISLNISSLILAVYTTALLAGMLVKNYMIKYMEEKNLLLISIAMSFVFLLLAFLIPNITAKVIFIFLFGVNVAGNFSLTYSMGLNIGAQFTNIVSSLLHTSSYLGVVLFQYLSGYLSENFSEDSVLYIDLALLLLLIVVVAIMNKRELRYLSRNIDIK
jgi:fucose permease